MRTAIIRLPYLYLSKETRVIESPLIIHYEPKIGLVESNDYIYMLAQHLSVQILKSSVVSVSSKEIIFQSTNYSARTTLIGVAERAHLQDNTLMSSQAASLVPVPAGA